MGIKRFTLLNFFSFFEWKKFGEKIAKIYKNDYFLLEIRLL